MATERGTRKERIGVVVSDKMDKTRVIRVEWSQPHPLYQRRVRRMTRFKAHDAENATHVGDRVRMVETRPLSKEKRWRIIEVLERAEAIELRPEEVDTTLLREMTEKPPAPAEAPSSPTASIPAVEAPAPAAEAPANPVAEASAAPAQPEGEKKPKPRARRKKQEEPAPEAKEQGS